MIRHGSRSVLKNYPTEEIPLSYWDKYGGLGQLTPAGTRQLYEYGKFTRNLYKDFISSTYHPAKHYARSTDLDRNLNSGYAFLAGLFQASSDQKWNTEPALANWIPIPVHASPIESDIEI